MSKKYSTILEIRPGNGGKDAEDFAAEITNALVKRLNSARYAYHIQPMSNT